MTKPLSPPPRFGISDEHFSLLQHMVIDPLVSAGARVWIFGSRARGSQRPTSDVDLLFEFPPTTPPPAGLLYSVKSDLEESRFPFTMDLVNVKDLAASYRDNILAERVELSQRSSQ